MPLMSNVTLASLAIVGATFVFASVASAEDLATVPTLGVDVGIAVDHGAERPGYAGGTGAGIDLRTHTSFVGLFLRREHGFFVRDMSMLDLGFGGVFGGRPDFTSALFGRLWLRTGVMVGFSSHTSAFYLHPQIFTGFDTARNPLHADSGAWRSAWLMGAGVNLLLCGFNFGMGRGTDSASDTHTVIDASVYIKPFTERVLVLFDLLVLHYQAVLGDQTVEHDFTLSLGARL